MQLPSGLGLTCSSEGRRRGEQGLGQTVPFPSNAATSVHFGTEGVDFLGRIHLPAVWPWASGFTSLSLSLLVWQMEILTVFQRAIISRQCIDLY